MAIEILQTRKILAEGGPEVGDLESSVMGLGIRRGDLPLETELFRR
jgi:hypothetical protein